MFLAYTTANAVIMIVLVNAVENVSLCVVYSTSDVSRHFAARKEHYRHNICALFEIMQVE